MRKCKSWKDTRFVIVVARHWLCYQGTIILRMKKPSYMLTCLVEREIERSKYVSKLKSLFDGYVWTCSKLILVSTVKSNLITIPTHVHIYLEVQSPKVS